MPRRCWPGSWQSGGGLTGLVGAGLLVKHGVVSTGQTYLGCGSHSMWAEGIRVKREGGGGKEGKDEDRPGVSRAAGRGGRGPGPWLSDVLWATQPDAGGAREGVDKSTGVRVKLVGKSCGHQVPELGGTRERRRYAGRRGALVGAVGCRAHDAAGGGGDHATKDLSLSM